MILRILAVSLVALGLGFMIEDGKAAKTVLCRDGRIVEVDEMRGRDAADLCRRVRTEHLAPTGSVPLPIKRPAPTRKKVELKGPAEVTPGSRGSEPFQSASTDFPRVRIINARPGASRWYRHAR